MSKKAVTKIQPDTKIFEIILEAALKDLNGTISAVAVDALHDAVEAHLYEIFGPAASGIAKQVSIEDVRRELLTKHKILTIPVFKTFFTKRHRVRALHGHVEFIKQVDGSRKAVRIPPDPIRLLPLGYGKMKSGLVRADAYPMLLALWTQRDRVWANGSWNAYDRRLGDTYDAGLLDTETLAALLNDTVTAPIPKHSNLARIINDVRRLGVTAVASLPRP